MTSTKTLQGLARAGSSHRKWYRSARASLRSLSAFHGWDYGRTCDIVAVTSPRLAVVRNLRVASQYLKTDTVPVDVTRSTRAALKHYEATGQIRGPKTSRFALALRGDDSQLVLDSWMAEALNVDPMKIGAKYNRAPAERRFARVARVFAWTMCEVQAAVWAAFILSQGPDYNVPAFDVKEFVPF